MSVVRCNGLNMLCGSILSLVQISLFLGMVMYDNEFKTDEYKI